MSRLSACMTCWSAVCSRGSVGTGIRIGSDVVAGAQARGVREYLFAYLEGDVAGPLRPSERGDPRLPVVRRPRLRRWWSFELLRSTTPRWRRRAAWAARRHTGDDR